MENIKYQIFKYPLPFDDEVTISAKQGKILNIIDQNGVPTLYIKHDIEDPEERFDYKILILGTGHIRKIPDEFTYLTTLTFLESKLVFHFFVKAPNFN